ncbi:hypothetical protein MMC24_000337 [Lignoscripta atroalba]|nr:hypothetical protein [Lignoscripta atroalba]
MVGPKEEEKAEGERGMRYHAKEVLTGPGRWEWVFEEHETCLSAANMLLVRVMVGKVADVQRLEKTLHNTAVVQGDRAWNCVSWVKDALEALRAEEGKALGTCQLDWSTVRDRAMRYCQEKRDQHRFDGTRSWDMSRAPTYDLLVGRETIA